MWKPIKRGWLRRSGAQCILIETDSSSRFRRGELLTAGLDRFIVVGILPLPRRRAEVLRRWEIWVVSAERRAPPAAPASLAACSALAWPQLLWSLIEAAAARAHACFTDYRRSTLRMRRGRLAN
jgi:hypothetical protein